MGVTTKPSVYLLFVIVLSIILSSGVFAAITGFESYQDYRGNRGYVRDIYSYWNTTPDLSADVGAGSLYQPLVADYDGNGEQNIMQFINNNLYVFIGQELGTPSLTNVGVVALPNDTQTHPALWLNNSNDKITWLTVANNSLFAYTWDGDLYGFHNAFADNSQIDGCTSWSGIKCSSNDYCYAVCRNDSISTHMVRFDMNVGTYTIGASLGNITLKTYGIPAISNSGLTFDDIAFACDVNRNNNFGLCVVRGDTLGFDTTFASVGYIDDISAYFSNQPEAISNPIWLPATGGLFESIYISYLKSATCALASAHTPCLGSYTRSGINSWATCANDIAVCPTKPSMPCCNPNFAVDTVYVGQPFGAYLGDELKICAAESAGYATTMKLLGCLDVTTGSRDVNLTAGTVAGAVNFYGTTWSSGRITNGLAFANTGDITNDYLVFGNALYKAKNSSSMALAVDMSAVYGNNEMISFYDITGDGNGEILTSKALSTKALYSAVPLSVNNVPVIDNSKATGGYYGYYVGATCLGTTVTFEARQCPSEFGCGYSNDVSSDTERLSTDCGTGTATYGAYSADNPKVVCNYNTTGAYPVRIYLQDNIHASDLTQYNSELIMVNVIDGIDGTTCNIEMISSPKPKGGNLTSQQIEAQTIIDTSINDVFDIFLGTSPYLKGFFAMLIILFVVYEFATKLPSSPVIAAIAGMITAIFLTTIGFIPLFLMIIVLVSMVLTLVFKGFITTSRESG